MNKVASKIVKRVETITLDLDMDTVESFELPTNVYGGVGNGGKQGRDALALWQRENPGVDRIPQEFIGAYSVKPWRVVVVFVDNEETERYAIPARRRSTSRRRRRTATPGATAQIPAAHWPVWLTELVDAAIR